MTHPFTPEYIAMAKAAEEIQDQRNAKSPLMEGDWCLDPDSKAPTCVSAQGNDTAEYWIPRLDQLLGMLVEDGRTYDFLFSKDRDSHANALSRFMLSRYEKEWDGKEWVKA